MDGFILLGVCLAILLTDLYVSAKWKRTRRSTIELKEALDRYTEALDKRSADIESAQSCLSAWGQALAERDDMLSGYFIAIADEAAAAERSRNEDGAE